MMTCCTDPANRKIVYQMGASLHLRCVVCGRNHYEIEADPIPVGVRVAPLTAPQTEG